MNYYDASNISSILPLPLYVLPINIAGHFSQDQLQHNLFLAPCTFKDLIEFYLYENRHYLYHNITASTCLLSNLSKYSSHFSESKWLEIKNILSNIKCIPTIQGMKLPNESYIPSHMLTSDSPAITLNILPDKTTTENQRNINNPDENLVSTYFLKQIGCRMLNIQSIIKYWQMNSNNRTELNQVNIQTLIKSLMKERKYTTDEDFKALKQSRFLQDAGIKVLPSIFNAVILCAVLSVGNSSVYGASRTLCALAENNQAPKLFTYIDRKGRSLSALALSIIIGFIAYVNCAKVGTKVFDWLLAPSGLSAFFTWGSICACHIMFRLAWKAQGHTLDELAFVSPFRIVGSCFGLLLNILCLIAQFCIAVSPIRGSASAKSFFEAYLAALLVIVSYIVWKIWKRTSIVRPSTIDLETERRILNVQQLIDEERAERRAWPIWKKVFYECC
ncbi:unnamed protein product [Adineta steineri]|uniref:Amino acid permease/ SLC12A domain-containing protein n=1 Tax=Adineta steineri TaxID=433720 RepID=A0A819GZF0_9BILA|nr:unnamed protein product [Adineta steineri]CAF3889622.1 unnamed protein product [Adineta steineri]